MSNLEQDLNWYQACKRDMTYILGAKCRNGIVLVGDTKITIGDGTDFTYAKKITFPLNNVVMGSAGTKGLYEEFQRRITTKVDLITTTKGSNKLLINTENGFLTLITKVIREMHNDYGKDSYQITRNLMILCATRIRPQSRLTVFYGDGSSEIVNDIRAIGNGESYGTLFHKKMWTKSMTMKQTAKLGLFIIRCIQKMHLNENVGYRRRQKCWPQVVYIPNVVFPKGFPKSPPINLPKEELDKLQKKYNELLVKYPIEELPEEKIKIIIEKNEPKVKKFGKFIKELL